jgi:hypothetical protein
MTRLTRDQKLLNRFSKIRKTYLAALARENHRHIKMISKIEVERQVALDRARLAE